MTKPSTSIHETWTIFQGISDWDSFQNTYLPELYLKKDVPKDVGENFKVVEDLLNYSFFQYKFYDVATLKTLLTLEMSLKIRYKELTGLDWGKKSLRMLMKWFEHRNYFEVYNKFYLDGLRTIRNMLAHPLQHNFSGASSKDMIENIVDLVNGLYENPALRRKRISLMLTLIKAIDRFGSAMRISDSGKIYWAYSAWPAFINNKGKVREIHFYYRPIFEVPDEHYLENGWEYAPFRHLNAQSFKVMTDKITFLKNEGDEVTITGITNAKEQKMFGEWSKKYKNYGQPRDYLVYTDSRIIDTHSLHLREFHKT